jgi:hypothetical protein
MNILGLLSSVRIAYICEIYVCWNICHRYTCIVQHLPHRKRFFHYCVFSRCCGNMSTELFPSNGCCTVDCLHSCYLAMGLHVTLCYENRAQPVGKTSCVVILVWFGWDKHQNTNHDGSLWPTLEPPTTRLQKVLASRLQPPAQVGSSLADFSTLRMEAMHTSETSAHIKSTRRHIPKDGILHSHLRGDLKFYNLIFLYIGNRILWLPRLRLHGLES